MQRGLIIENVSNKYIIKTENKMYNCLARGKLKQDSISPTVGDMVNIEVLNEETNEAIINEILERKTYIKRPKISNVSQIMLVISSKHPKPDLLMLDKQLAYSELMNIKPVIIINKIDLAKKDEILNIEKIYTQIGYNVIKTNAITKVGIDKVKAILEDNISVFSGNSGVGKSTLINSLFDEKLTEEGNISLKNKRGKNTTTSTTLYEIYEDSYIADTPGFSTFDIDEIETVNLYKYFKEFKEKVKDCEFVGCTHIKEKNCEIKKDVEKGTISKGRYERYCIIYNELKDKEKCKWKK